jgi:hypothetical protein
MTIDDLEHIFKPQLEEGTTKLYFMLSDGGDTPVVERCDAGDMDSLIHMLSHFQYAGTIGGMPRFKKGSA